MIQELYQKAMKFAGEKHCNQHVAGTKANYLLHLSNVAMEVLMAYQNKPDFNIQLAIQMAILHDSLEDTSITFTELKNQFNLEVAKGVQALTKDTSLPTKEGRMLDSLNRINTLTKEVGIVKLADRITNLQAPPKHWTKNKIQTYYTEAQLISKLLVDKNDYLYKRLNQKIIEYKAYM